MWTKTTEKMIGNPSAARLRSEGSHGTTVEGGLKGGTCTRTHRDGRGAEWLPISERKQVTHYLWRSQIGPLFSSEEKQSPSQPAAEGEDTYNLLDAYKFINNSTSNSAAGRKGSCLYAADPDLIASIP